MGDIDIDLRPKAYAYDEVEHVTFLAFIDCRIVVDNHTVIPLLLFGSHGHSSSYYRRVFSHGRSLRAWLAHVILKAY